MNYDVYSGDEKVASFKYLRDAIEMAQRYAERSLYPTNYKVQDDCGRVRHVTH